MKIKLLLLLLLANFSIYAQQYTLIPDVNFEKTLIAKGIDSGAPDGKVLTSNISSLTILSLYNFPISDLTGIEGFTGLTSLYVSNNLLTSIDLSQNINLKNLNVANNKLTSLDISANTLLETLECPKNTLSSLNLSANSKLTLLNAANNQVTSLDLSQNKQLIDLNIGFNGLLNLDIRSNLLLQTLDCRKNAFTTLDISNNTNLINLNASSNQLGILDLSQNTQLKNLTLSFTQLTSLNVDNNIALTSLTCDNNTLTSLNVSKNTLLTSLICHYNQIDVLNVSKNTLLEQLMCQGNKLTSLDVSLNPELNLLDCLDNKLTSLDISKNPKITELACQNNQLQTLNLKNGHNEILDLTFSNFTNNPNLSCITVDDNVYSNTNWMSIKDATAFYNTNCSSLYTLIPDVNFEKKLISRGLDSGVPDGKVLTNNIASVKSLDINNSKIKDLTGIEAFTNLEVIYCGDNELTSLDFSNNLKLKQAECYENKLTSINISKNTELWYLDVFTNQLTTLDLSKNKLLTTVYCYDNLLTSLNITGLTALEGLDCPNNQLTSLDVSTNTSLQHLFCFSNKLTSLDISKNPILNEVSCYSNDLTSLNLKNGNNKNFTKNSYIKFINNPNLTCIEVDDVAYSNANWATIKDAVANYSSSCTPLYTSISDANLEQKLIDLGIDTDGLNGKISTENINSVTSLDLSNSGIKDVSAIKNFTALISLDLSNNQITSLDLSNNLLLETVDLSSNQLTTLDLSKNTKVRIVYVVDNPLVSLNLKNGNNKNFILQSNTGKKSASELYTSFLGLKTLGCIQVDDENYSNANWSNIKESTTVYSNTCKTLGVDKSSFAQVAVYPNPTKGELNINNIALDKATVYNSLGQLVKSFTLNNAKTDNTINLSGLPKGIYYVYLINEDTASAKKIIVE